MCVCRCVRSCVWLFLVVQKMGNCLSEMAEYNIMAYECDPSVQNQSHVAKNHKLSFLHMFAQTGEDGLKSGAKNI